MGNRIDNGDNCSPYNMPSTIEIALIDKNREINYNFPECNDVYRFEDEKKLIDKIMEWKDYDKNIKLIVKIKNPKDCDEEEDKYISEIIEVRNNTTVSDIISKIVSNLRYSSSYMDISWLESSVRSVLNFNSRTIDGNHTVEELNLP